MVHRFLLFKLLFVNLFKFLVFLFVDGERGGEGGEGGEEGGEGGRGGGSWVASNFAICIYMLTLQFHPVLVMSSEISPLH